MKKLFHVLFCVATLCSASMVVHAATPEQGGQGGTPRLPLDPAVRRVQLDNGLTFYIRVHPYPAKRASLRLVVRAGSLAEDDDQRGLAHFVEHMAFNGTRRFKKNEIDDYFEKVGMRLGSDSNANTGYDRTIYELEVPTDDPGVLKQSLLVLEQFAAEVTFTAEDVEKERGVMVEEWRLQRGVGERIRQQQLPVLLRGSRYVEREIIGKKEILEHAPPATLIRFYRDFYRPAQMAVIAVGDFDPAVVETELRRLFAPLKNPVPARPEVVAQVPEHEDTRVSIQTDPELVVATVSVFHKRPHARIRTETEYRQVIVAELFQDMLNARLTELARSKEPPFLGARAGTTTVVDTLDALVLGAAVKADAMEAGLAALGTELERLLRHGFAETELVRAKADALRGLQNQAKEKDKTNSNRLAAELIRNYLDEEAVLGIDGDLQIYEKILPTITLATLKEFAGDWISSRNRVILATAPKGAAVPSEAALRAAFERAFAAEVTPYHDQVKEGPLVTLAVPPGRIVAATTFPALGTTEWRLSNGVRVVLKPTDFKNDEVQMHSFSPGGHSLVDDADFQSAASAASLIGQSGRGGFGPIELHNRLAGQLVSVAPTLSELSEGFEGWAAPADLETLFQLIYLSMTAPRADPEVFAASQSALREVLAKRRSSPEAVFSDEYTRVLYAQHPRRLPLTLADADKIQLERALRIYRDRFADASDFTFFFVGSFTVETLRPLVLRYLATLPARGRKERYRDLNVHFPPSHSRFTVRQGIEPKTHVRLTFFGEKPLWTMEEEHDLDALGEALTLRLQKRLREDEGSVYAVSVSASFGALPRPTYQFSIGFGCAPENAARLETEVLDEIAHIRREGFQDTEIEKVRAAERRDWELLLKKNDYWMGALVQAYWYGQDPRVILRQRELPVRVDQAHLLEAARRFLDPSHYILGQLDPLPPAAAPAPAGTPQPTPKTAP